MSKNTINIKNIRVNKKEFHKSKQTINLVNIDQIVVSDKFKHSDNCFQYFIGYKESEIVKPLCQINAMKFGTRLKRHEALNFIACLFMMKNA